MRKIEYTVKNRYQLPGAELDGALHQYLIINDTHYLLNEKGRIYRGELSNDGLEVEPLKIDELKDTVIKRIAGNNQGEVYFLDKNHRVYCLKDNSVTKSGCVVNVDGISDFYVGRMGERSENTVSSPQNRYLFFFVAEKPSYCWYEELEIFDLTNKYFYKRNLFGLLGNDTLVHSSQHEYFIMFLTRNDSGSRTYAIVVDVINEKVTHCINTAKFVGLKGVLIKGILIDENSFIFLTDHNELLCIYHLKEMINTFLKKKGSDLERETAGKWEKWRKGKGLPPESNVGEAYNYAKDLKNFIEENNLSKKYTPLLHGIDVILAGNHSYGPCLKDMADLHQDFRDSKACDIYYFDNFLHVIALNGFVYKISISFEDFSS